MLSLFRTKNPKPPTSARPEATQGPSGGPSEAVGPRRHRPVACIARQRVGQPATTWCNHPTLPEAVFLDVEHAASHKLTGGALKTCPECVIALLLALPI